MFPEHKMQAERERGTWNSNNPDIRFLSIQGGAEALWSLVLLRLSNIILSVLGTVEDRSPLKKIPANWANCVLCLFVPGMHRNGFRMETSLGFAAAPRCSHGSCAGEHVTFVSDQFADHCVALTCRPIFYGRHFYEFHIRHFSPLNLQHRKQDLKIIADFVSFKYIYISYRIYNIFCYHLLQPQFFWPVQSNRSVWPVGPLAFLSVGQGDQLRVGVTTDAVQAGALVAGHNLRGWCWALSDAGCHGCVEESCW